MKLADIMTRVVVTVDMDETVERIRTLFESSGFHHLIVTDDARVVGVISDRDLLKHLSPFVGKPVERAMDAATLSKKAHHIMTRHPVLAHEDMETAEATDLLLRKGVGCLPVVTKGLRLSGIVTWRDLLKVCFMCKPRNADAA